MHQLSEIVELKLVREKKASMCSVLNALSVIKDAKFGLTWVEKPRKIKVTIVRK